MATTAKQVNYTERDKAIAKVLMAAENALTMEELNAQLPEDLQVVSGHITGAKNKGIVLNGEDREVVRMGKKKVNSYKFVSATKAKDAKGQECNYTDNQLAVMTAALSFEGNAFTLAELSEVMGVSVAPAVATTLVNRGNFEKGEQVEVEAPKKAKVKTYMFNQEFNTANLK